MLLTKLIGEADRATVTTLVDNSIERFASEMDQVRRLSPGMLLAEHGLAFLIEIEIEGSKKVILMDTGKLQALSYNLTYLKIDPEMVETLVISHGHRDHTGGLISFLKSVERDLPIIIHPDAFQPSIRISSKKRVETSHLLPLTQEAVEAVGGRLIVTARGFPLFTGTTTTGQVERKEPFEELSGIYYLRGTGILEESAIRDDQAIVINLKDRGLVVLSGCAHSGIINVIRHSQKITGVERIYAVIGGFHLATASDERLEKTTEALMQINPKILSPMHCSGFKFVSKIAREMPDSFVINGVGTQIIL